MTQTIISIKWGARYGPEYGLNRLYRAVKKYTKQPTRFICFTEDALGIDEGVIIYDLPEVNLPDYPHSPPFRTISSLR